MYFLTVWLKEEDSDELIEKIFSLIENYVKKYCKSEILDKKLSSSGKRVTVTLPCDKEDYNCTQQNGQVKELISELKKSVNRVARAKAKCIRD